ncbi:MAG TPA: sigma-70 family RNA polymerase sigma factor [Thermoanaerobaculia bacterium]|jgi:RNA polymerase sigma factor for flagellar operon FliA
MNPETTYLQNLDTIERIAAFVARRNHLNADEGGEFTQVVRVKLFEDDYAIIRKFQGLSSFSTYLTTVILRLCQQWRVEMWGKWRPSAEARRLGDKAITLERLITRDGLTYREAVKVLTTRAGSLYTVAELEALYIRLPVRNPRPVLVPEEVAPQVAAMDAEADDLIESRDRERSARCCAGALDVAIAKFPEEDRLILRLRFWDSRKVPEIARIVGIDQKKIYKRLEKLLKVLRVALEGEGVTRADVDKMLSAGDQEIRLDGLSDEETPPSVPLKKRGR